MMERINLSLRASMSAMYHHQSTSTHHPARSSALSMLALARPHARWLTVAFLTANLITDLAYAVANPRIRIG